MQNASPRIAEIETAQSGLLRAAVHDMRPSFEIRATMRGLHAPSDIAVIPDLALLLVPLEGGPMGVRFGGTIGREVSLTTGDALLVAAQTPILVRLPSPVNALLVEFSENLVRTCPLPALGRRRGHHAILSGRASRPASLVGTARLLAADIFSDAGGYAFRSALILAMMECLAQDEALVAYREEFTSDFTIAGVERAIRHIEANLAEPISLDRLAAHAGISPFHLSRSFRRITGLGIKGYLQERRLRQACRLLADTRKPLAEIAYDCGFSSQSRMTTVFRKLLDTTPLAYRQSCRNPAGVSARP